jgi:hypothetical protein
MKEMVAVGAATVFGCVIATAAQSQVRVSGAVTTITLPSQPSGGAIDVSHAKPMALPAARTLPPATAEAVDPLVLFGQPGGGSPGSPGTGEQNPVQLLPPQEIPQGLGVEPGEFATSGQPYTASEVNAYGDTTVNYYPFRAAGILYLIEGTGSTINAYCSASLIQTGVLVTAAHCVANYGQKQFYKGWTFVTTMAGRRTGHGLRVL